MQVLLMSMRDEVCTAGVEYKYEYRCAEWLAVECTLAINYFISSQPASFHAVIRMQLRPDHSLMESQSDNIRSQEYDT